MILSLSDYDGKVSSFSLPDADGVINQPRFVHFGGYGSSLAEAFDVPETLSKDARFRTVYTGGWQTDWGWWGGVDELRLTKPGGGFSGLYPYGAEWGRAWSPRVGPMTGNQNVTWSSVCSTNCASATDMLEWRVWETGAPQFNTRLRSPGQYHDAETDFYENWNRFYDPSTGRYLSSEPAVSDSRLAKQTFSRPLPNYAYADNNSVRNGDRDGNIVWDFSQLPAGRRTSSSKYFKEAAHQLRNWVADRGQQCEAHFAGKYGVSLRDLLKDDSGPRFDVKRFKKPVGGENTGSNSCDFNVNNDKQNIPRCTLGKIIHELAHIAKSKSSGSATPDAYSFSGEGYEAERACFGSLDGSRPPSADNSCALSGQ